jgi:hypothetical protein|tara:strand:+ start:413 stop:907 length:495 start_codon:yes stop_codon:yes gene_type:complete
MHPYLNVKPTYSPTFLSYNGTRSGPGIWGDPQTPMLLFPLALFLICSGILCNFIKLKYCPNTCYRHPTEGANNLRRRTPVRTPVRVEPTPTIQQLTRQVDVLTSVLLELVQNENRIQDENRIQNELEKNNEEDIENNNDQNNNDETKTETSEESTEEQWKSIEV